MSLPVNFEHAALIPGVLIAEWCVDKEKWSSCTYHYTSRKYFKLASQLGTIVSLGNYLFHLISLCHITVSILSCCDKQQFLISLTVLVRRMFCVWNILVTFEQTFCYCNPKWLFHKNNTRHSENQIGQLKPMQFWQTVVKLSGLISWAVTCRCVD